jgi:2-polyprenyl-3-methyl-5-hydroxy-6-metoxy-1,4-benzoquinol methylase
MRPRSSRARRSAPAGVEFSTRRLGDLPDRSFDVVSVVDVLYTVRREVWDEILAGCFRVLRPGGRLILKEVVDRPRWKYWAIMAQETFSVTLFGLTKGERPHFESPADYCRAVAQAGLSVLEAQPLRSATWISHYLVVAQKPISA